MSDAQCLLGSVAAELGTAHSSVASGHQDPSEKGGATMNDAQCPLDSVAAELGTAHSSAASGHQDPSEKGG